MANRRYEVGVGCLVVVAAGVLAYMALKVGAISVPHEVVHVDALLPDAAGLSVGAVVSVAGVQVGRVEGLKVDFDKARASLVLDSDAQLREDVRVAMRARSVLGEKYLEVIPVSREAPLLKNGDVITDVQGQVEIDEMVNHLGPLVEALDPKATQQIVGAFAAAVQEDPERPKRMLADAEHALHNAAVASDELPGMVADARSTLQSVKRTSEAARPVIARLDGTTKRLDEIVENVPPDQIPAVLADLRGAIADGRAVLVKLDGSTADLSELLSKANKITPEEIHHIAREEGVLIRLFPEKKEEK